MSHCCAPIAPRRNRRTQKSWTGTGAALCYVITNNANQLLFRLRCLRLTRTMMKNALRGVVLSCALLPALTILAQPGAPATCTRSANLLACADADGNRYSVNTVGNTLYLRGFEKDGHRYWAQTNSRFGQLTFFTGIASNGEAWVGYTRRVGWTTINRFSSSGGRSSTFTCSRITGC